VARRPWSVVAFLCLLSSISCLPSSVSAQSFSDVTTSAGVANSTSSQSRLPTSAAWGDFDGDGDLDLYVTNWASSLTQSFNRLYRNNGNGSFSDVAGSAGVNDGVRNSVGALWADYDNDGDLDLYIVNFFEQDQLYRNNGSGSFSNVTGSAGVNVISQGDELAAAFGDFDGDGDLDLYVCKARFRNTLYHNNGDGTFSEIGQSAGVADVRDSEHAAWGDFDNDGDLDLYVVNREQTNSLYRNNGNGSFSEIACEITVDNTDIGRSARWIDYDSDGDLDLYLANVGANALYRNDGNLTLSAGPIASPAFTNVATGDLSSTAGAWVSWAASWGDYDADGVADLFVANGAESEDGQVSALLVGSGDGFFTEATASGISSAASSGMAAAAGDYDGDGSLDLYLVNSRFPTFEPNVLYRNTSGGSTITVRPLRTGAADGIGARVSLLQNGALIAHQNVASGSDAPEAVFGVTAGQSYDIEVAFPGSTTPVTRTAVSAGNRIDVEQ